MHRRKETKRKIEKRGSDMFESDMKRTGVSVEDVGDQVEIDPKY